MEFKLDPYRRNISEELLIRDLQRVSNHSSKSYISTSDYDKYGLYSSGTVRRRFGCWNLGLEKAGLSPNGNWCNISDDSYVEDIKKVACCLKKLSITQSQYDNFGKYSSSAIRGRFGSWFKALAAAGLERTRNLGISNDQYFLNLEKVWRTLGRQPVSSDMRKPLSEYSVDAYADRFGTWRKALEAFVKYVNEEPNSIKSQDDATTNTINHIVLHDKKIKKNRYISWRLRFLIMRRDGFRCCICGRSPANESGVILHIDHITAYANNGTNDFNNLQTLCSVCNIGKGNLDSKEVS